MFTIFQGDTSFLHPILSAFYENILSDPRNSAHFKDKSRMRRLIASVSEHMGSLHNFSEDDLKTKYCRLGFMHSETGVSFTSFENASDYLHRELLHHFKTGSFDNAVQLNDYFCLLNNYVSLGYFEHEQSVFLERMRMLNRHAKNTVILKDFIEWFLMMHTVMFKKSCDGHSVLNSSKPAYPDSVSAELKPILTDIKRIDAEFNSTLTSMTFYIDNNDHRHTLDAYHRLKEHFFAITNLISVLEQGQIVQSFARDALTGALTRKEMTKLIDRTSAVAMSTGLPFCIAMADIDHFKKVNDTYGHKSGDSVLVQFAKLLMTKVEIPDVQVVRYGGEEFMILMPQCDRHRAQRVLEDVRLIIELTPMKIDTGMIHISASFGMVECLPPKGSLPEPLELIRMADENLYKAKQTGRNRVVA